MNVHVNAYANSFTVSGTLGCYQMVYVPLDDYIDLLNIKEKASLCKCSCNKNCDSSLDKSNKVTIL